MAENQNPYGRGNGNQNPCGWRNGNQNPYGQGNGNQNPYGQRNRNQNPYGQGNGNQNPYGRGNGNQNPYGRGNGNQNLSYGRENGYPPPSLGPGNGNRNPSFGPGYRNGGQSPYGGMPPAQPAKKRRGWILPLGIALSVLLVCGGGTGVYFWMEKEKGPRLISKTEIDYNYDGVKLCSRKIEYDQKGKRKADYEYHYHESGVVTSFIENAYDSKGNLITVRASGGIRQEFEYDSKGRAIKITNYMDDELYSLIEQGYDSKGRENKYIRHNETGEEASWDFDLHRGYPEDSWGTFYEEAYDRKGRLIHSVAYDGDSGEVEERIDYEYASDGSCLKTQMRADGSTAYEFHTDPDGEERKRVCYNEDGSIGRLFEYTYDSDGRAISYHTFEADNTWKKDTYQYFEYETDADGNITKRITTNTDGAVDGWTVYEYSFA